MASKSNPTPEDSSNEPRKKKAASAKAPADKKPAAKKKASSKKAASKKAAKPVSPPRPDEMPADVLEFITAIDDYKRRCERPFPSWTEILEVLKGLGYEKAAKG